MRSLLLIVFYIDLKCGQISSSIQWHPLDQSAVLMTKFLDLEDLVIEIDDIQYVKHSKMSMESSGNPLGSRHCNRFTCFDPLQCQLTETKQISYYVYPPIHFLSSNGQVLYSSRSMISQEYLQFLGIMLSSHRSTRDPSRACLFIPSIDLGWFHPINSSLLSTLYEHLPHWHINGGVAGTNHVKVMLDPAQSVDLLSDTSDNSIVIASNMNTWNYRPEFDMAIPALSGDSIDDKAAMDRRYGLVFTQYDSINERQKRFVNRLKQIAGDDFLLLGHSCIDDEITVLEKDDHQTSENSGSNIYASSCMAQVSSHLQQVDKTACRCTKTNSGIKQLSLKFPQVLSSARYCLILQPYVEEYSIQDNDELNRVPLGDSTHYLIAKALRYGCVPILDDEIVLPYNHMINWTEISYAISTGHDEPLTSTIEAVSQLILSNEGNSAKLAGKLSSIWSRHFKSVGQVASISMDYFDSFIYPRVLLERT